MGITRKLALVVCLFAFVCGGCARIAIYEDSKLTEQTGIKFYASKPYVFVSNTGGKDKPVEIQIVYLPDIKKPYYAKMIGGIGASDFKMAFSNGMLTSIGMTADTKLPENLAALASLGTSVGGMATSFATARKIAGETDLLKQSFPPGAIGAGSLPGDKSRHPKKAEVQQEPKPKVFKVVTPESKVLRDSAELIDQAMTNCGSYSPAAATPNNCALLPGTKQKLQFAIAELEQFRNESAERILGGVVADLNTILTASDGSTTLDSQFSTNLDNAKKMAREVHDSIGKKKAQAFQFFEIDNTGTIPRLIPVEVIQDQNAALEQAK